jgi:hypothetical protein
MSYKPDYPTVYDARAIELPSLHEIQEMDRQRQEAIESLEISAWLLCQVPALQA